MFVLYIIKILSGVTVAVLGIVSIAKQIERKANENDKFKSMQF